MGGTAGPPNKVGQAFQPDACTRRLVAETDDPPRRRKPHT